MAVVKKKKPLLSATHRKRRLAFALKYQNWTIEDWKKEYMWKKKGEGLTSREVKGWNGVGALSEVEGRMDAEQYVAILDGGLLQSMEDSGIPANEVIFQQDNDPKHTSRRA
ncbi:hypothetical protein PAXRUDRAFT_18328 [Paxillus rubicundulus Ve08.2h10]|uniref:Transposase Tc1-like domain-containing protein n=1 Tax=Paxillus rubicundulus Ve08.2h10 TaxID=930991 RepID=A0A0D0DF47_9AGAM|nr:hypothetical protein PAXRUDRAFT_18328 [Paxillus rubicundulus Ve08.2h10]